MSKPHKATSINAQAAERLLAANSAPNTPARPRLMTVARFCETYALSKSYAYELLKAGKINGVKVGAKTRITLDSVQAWEGTLQRFKSA